MADSVRRCNRRGESKPLEAFAWHRKSLGQRQHHCRECMCAHGREHYRAYRQKYIEAEARRKRARMEERMQYLVNYLRSHPCVDCGEADPLVLEFDHLGDKSFAVSQGFAGRNWQSILDEMAKCDVVCANCHKRRTAARAGHMRAAVLKTLAG